MSRGITNSKVRQKRSLSEGYFEDKLQSLEERREAGKALRKRVPREAHGEWKEKARSRDPIEILIASNQGRLQELVPIRHGRMLSSPFAFLRGAAAGMAHDLSKTPATGIRVQACGDCHLMNFGAFGTPERQMNFSINDFDETHPAPWEWDLKRLAASIVVAGRHIDLKERDARAAAESAARSYRRRMRDYSGMRVMDVWYDHVNIEQVIAALPRPVQQRLSARVRKARTQNVAEHDFPKLTERSRQQPRIKDNAPLIFHLPGNQRRQARENVVQAVRMYRNTLAEQYRVLFDRFRLYDLAVKVVGVGSVGTMCLVALFMASDSDPMILQIKQAGASVLEPYTGKSVFSNHGQRVVVGQRLMQAASDMMLGWTVGKIGGRHFYVRQLRDMKLSAIIETMDAEVLSVYAKLCGWALARAHARSGDPAMISGYLGNSDVFDKAIGNFAGAYADQSEKDYKAMRNAARTGRLEVAEVE